MPTITLSLPVSGTIVTASLHSSNYGALQTLLNGGLDNNNFATGKIFDTTKLMQSGATTGQALIWNGSNWAPATPPAYEVVSYTTATNFGPTTVTGTGNGDALFAFSAATFEAAKYYFELSALFQDNAGLASYEIRLHDGTAPGALVASAQFLTPGSNPGQPALIRFGFTPSAGSHTYQVRMRDVTGGRTYTISNANYAITARIVKA